MNHGTANAYCYHHCRCPECRAFLAAYNRAWRDRQTVVPNWVHGTSGGYTNYRCRCELCVAARSQYMAAYRARRRAVA